MKGRPAAESAREHTAAGNKPARINATKATRVCFYGTMNYEEQTKVCMTANTACGAGLSIEVT